MELKTDARQGEQLTQATLSSSPALCFLSHARAWLYVGGYFCRLGEVLPGETGPARAHVQVVAAASPPYNYYKCW
jgi:hypothetical protein